jgi:hypothetical protein
MEERVEDYSRFRVAVREIDAVEWLFPPGVPADRFLVRGVEVKATLQDLRGSTVTLNLL